MARKTQLCSLSIGDHIWPRRRQLRAVAVNRALQQVESLELRRLLSTSTWTSTTGGAWSTAADWSGGVVPPSGNDVVINKAGNITVTLTGSASVNSITVTGDTLVVSGGTLSVSANSSIGTSATLNLSNSTLSLASGASLNNSGAISVGQGSQLNDGGAYTATSTGSVSFASGVVGGNLLSNSGFESPSVGSSTTTTPSNWGNWGSSDASTAFAHSGSQSLLQTATGGSNSGVFQSVAVSAGVTYTASGYAMDSTAAPLSGPQGGFINISFQNASGGTISTGGAFITVVSDASATGSWIYSTTQITAPATATAASIDLQNGPYVYGPTGTGSGSVYWDDVSFGRQSYSSASGTATGISNSGSITIGAGAAFTDSGAYTEASTGNLTLQSGTAGTGVGTNLVQNPGFEAPSAGTSTTTGPDVWGTWGNTYVSAAYNQSGSQSLLQYGSNSGASQSFGVAPGVSYIVSVNVLDPASSSLTGSEGGYFGVSFSNANGGSISSPSTFQNVANSSSTPGVWVNYTAQLTAPAGAATINLDLQTYSGSGSAGGDVVWDNIQLGPLAITSAALSASSVSNSGVISVGVGDTLVSSGAFTQTTTGTLQSLLGGSPLGNFYGSVSAASSATLAGTLEATLVNGYTPSINDGFSVLTYASETGTFASYQLPSGSTYVFQPGVNPTYVGISAVPPTLAATINAAVTTTTASQNLVGVNLALWDSYLSTTQTQQMVEAAGLSILRFPGGSGSDDYHFNDQYNYGYSSNTIPEFAQFVSETGATGIVTVDYGTASPQEAEAELAYLGGSVSDMTTIGNGLVWKDSSNSSGGAWQTFNYSSVSYWASLRSAQPLAKDDGLNFMRINHPAIFSNIKYWEMGNEEYGSWEDDQHGVAGPSGVSTGAQHDPATYAAFMAAFESFDASDTSLLTVLAGIDSGNPTGSGDNNWTRNVVTDLYADGGYLPGFISDHNYVQSPGSESDSILLNSTVSSATSTSGWVTRHSDYEATLTSILGATKAATVQFLATEYNSNGGTPGKQMTSLVNGLFVADSVGSLLNAGYVGGLVWDLRNGWGTDGNNSPSLYGWRQGGDEGILGAGYSDAPVTGAYIPYPTYFGEQISSKIMQTGGLDISTVSSYAQLTIYSVLEPNGHLDLLVINKNPDSTLTGNFNISGFYPTGQAQVWQYGESQDYAQSQSATGAAALANSSQSLSLTGNNFAYSFPAYSMTVLDLTNLPIIAAATGSALTVTLNNIAPISLAVSGSTITVSELGEQLSFTGITSVLVNGSSVTDTLNTTGTLTAPVTFENSASTSLNVASGSIALANSSGTAINTQPLASLNIAATASVVLQTSGSYAARTVLDLASLTIAGTTGQWTAKLDLGGNDLVVTGGNFANIYSQLKQGYNQGVGGIWQGNEGIVSSAAAADASHLMTLGVILNTIDGTPTGAPLYGSGTTLGTFDGVVTPNTAILVKYTFYGDATLSGHVTGTDYSRIDANFNGSQTGWYFGDFNYDGSVDGSDYTLIDNAFNTQSANPTAQLADQISSKKSVASATRAPAFSAAVLSVPLWPPTSDDICLADEVLGEIGS